MTFFYDLNKKLDSIREKPEVTHGQLNERDMSRAAKGYEKYGKQGMEALAKAGREGKALDPVRAKYDKYDEGIEDRIGDLDMTNPVNQPTYQRKAAAQGGSKKDFPRFSGGAPAPEMPKSHEGFPRFSGEKSKQVKEKMNPAKAKSFAALAEPKDKITFADKIAGAKKEVDEMLGDVAAEAMRNALGGRQQVADEGNAFTGALAKTPKGGKFKVGGKEFTDTSGIDETRDDDDDVYAYQDPAKAKTHKTASGGTVTRHGGVTRHQAAPGHYGGYDPETDPDKDDDKPGTPAGEKRGRGRPKGAPKGPERVTAKAYKHKGGRKTNEGSDYGQAQQIYDELADIRAVAKQAQGGGQLPQGFASRLENSLWAAMSLIKNQQGDGAQVREEEKTTTRDNHAEKAGRKVTKDIEYDEKKKDGIHGKKRGAEDDKAEKAGKRVAKDIEYDEKKDEVKKDEPKKSKSKFKFGGSVYEALDAQLETLITEGMSVTVNMSKGSEDGHPGNKSITVNADGEDAERLAELLKMAGVSQHEETCSSCGSSPCGCDMIDENNPNWPTDTETSDNALQYSGGLNGPKSTGQSTVPVLASQLRRQVSMEESAKVEQNLLNLYKTFGK